MGKEGTSKELHFTEILGYALGDTGGVIAFGVVGSFLQMYYTDVLHISLAKITILMIVARVWDAINDPLWGAFIDARKPTKMGRFRPYILWMSVPLAVAFVLMFIKIPGLSEDQYLIYAYFTYILYGMMYTGTNIPYGSLASVMTEDEGERSTLSVARSFGSGIGSVPGQILLPLVVYSTAVDTGAKYLDASKMLQAVVLLAGFMVIIYFFSVKLTKEKIVPPEAENKAHFGKTLKVLIKNRPFWALSLASMLLITSQMYTQTINNYLFKNYYNMPGLFSMVTVATYLPMLAFMPFMGKLVKKYGKKELCAAGALFAAAAYVVLFFLHTQNAYVFLGFCFASGAGLTFFVLEVWALVIDVTDYQELLSKRREEGTSFACFSFTRKLGQTVAGAGSAIALGAIGYSTAKDAIVQDPLVVEKMYGIASLVPACMYLLIFLILAFGYNLGKENLARMHLKLKENRMKNI